MKLAVIDRDPTDPDEENQSLWHIPYTCINLRHYLSKMKYPPQPHDPIRIQMHLYDATACVEADQVNDAGFPTWTRAKSSATANPIFPVKNHVLGLDINRVKKIAKEVESIAWTLSPTDHFQPYTPFEFYLSDRMPAQLRGRINEEHIFEMLSNEKAFMAHIHPRARSSDTPEAYLEILKIAPLATIFKKLVVKAFMMLLSTLRSAANGETTLSISQLISDFKANFKSRMVMLFVGTISLSCDTGFLNGNHFSRAMGLRNAEEWKNFEKFLQNSCFALRHNMDINFVKKKMENFLEKQRRIWPNQSENLANLLQFFNEQYDSTAVLTQASDQLARLFWMLHKCPDKIAHNFR